MKKLVTFGLAAILAGCGKDPELAKPTAPVRNETPISNFQSDLRDLEQVGCVINLIPSEAGKGYNGIEVKLSPAWHRRCYKFESIVCEVPVAGYVSEDLRNTYQTKFLFREPVSLKDAKVNFYGVLNSQKYQCHTVLLRTKE